MIAAIIFSILVFIIGGIFLILLTQAMLPCDNCPLRKKCKQLEEDGHLNLCMQNLFKTNYGQNI